MAEPIVGEEEEAVVEDENPPCEDQDNQLKMEATMSRKEKRKAMKKSKRKQVRKEIALKEREEEEAKLKDPQEQARRKLLEQEEAERIERDRKEFEERERAWLEALEMKKRKEAEDREEEDRRKALEDSSKLQVENENNDDDDYEYVEEGPPEIIWQGNEIIVKKKKVRVPKKDLKKEDESRPTSNPLPPQSEAYADYNNASRVSAQQMLENVALQVPNFGTELDKAHCPFHLKTGACRFGQRCSRAHFYPDKSCTLLIKNMYSGPGISWEQDEGLEHTDEEVERCYEEFYEDVHTEFLKFGEIVNFKVCRNGSVHLRGNVYIHYKSLDSAVQAYQSINGRFFAGKQVSCEFVNVTKWKVAICGEYMKSRFKTCSHGTACNFIHCFRNPGGDYEWSDWDKPPPRCWIKKMVALFGYSDESGYEKQTEQEHLGQTKSSNKTMTMDADRHYLKRSRYREMDRSNNVASGGRWNDAQTSNDAQFDDREGIKVNDCSMSRNDDTDSDGDWSDRDRDRDRDRDKDRSRKNRQHNHGRESSRRHKQEVSRSPINDRYSKKATHESDSNGDWSDWDEDREARHDHARKVSGRRSRTHHTDSDTHFHANGRKRPRQRSKASKSPNMKTTRESDSGGDLSDRETHHGHARKSSRKRNKGHPDDDDGSRRKTRRTEWYKETHHSHGGESSRHQSKERYEGHHEDRKKRSRSNDLSKE